MKDVVLAGEMEIRVVEARPPGLWLQMGSIVPPIVKCAFCLVCLGLFGSALAGARLGFLADERLHGVLIAAAVILDGAILGAARRHHRRPGPLALCAVGALVAFAGLVSDLPAIETTGFAALMLAALWNVLLRRRHGHHTGACCDCGARSTTPGDLS